MSDIDKQIFQQAEKEFTITKNDGIKVFHDFRVEKVKARKGNRISSFRIYFEEYNPLKLF